MLTFLIAVRRTRTGRWTQQPQCSTALHAQQVAATRSASGRCTPALLALLLAACASPNDAPSTTQIRATDVSLQMRLSDAGPAWSMEGDKTMRELASQTPAGLDAPLRFVGGPIPPRPPFGAEVTVRFAVDSQGRVVRPQLLRVTTGSAVSVASISLGNDTIRAIANWRFTPPRRAQQATEYCCIKLTID